MTAGNLEHALQLTETLTETLPYPIKNLACGELVEMIIDYAKTHKEKEKKHPELQLLVGGINTEKKPEIYKIDLMQEQIRNTKDYALTEPIGEIGSGMERTRKYKKIEETNMTKATALWAAYCYFKEGSKNIGVDRNMGFCFIDRKTTRISHNENNYITQPEQYNAYLHNLLGGKIGISPKLSLPYPKKEEKTGISYDTALILKNYEILIDALNWHIGSQLKHCDWMARIQNDIYNYHNENPTKTSVVRRSEKDYTEVNIKLNNTISLLMKGGLKNIIRAINISHKDIIMQYISKEALK